MAKESRNIEYLGNHAERLNNISNLQEGRLYVVGRGYAGFVAFVMPEEHQIDRKGYGPEDSDKSITINGIDLYEARLEHKGHDLKDERIQLNSSILVDEFMDFPEMGVFEPTRGTELRKTIERGLAKDSDLRKMLEREAVAK